MSGRSGNRRHSRRISRTTSADRLRQENLRRFSFRSVFVFATVPLVCAALLGVIWINAGQAIQQEAEDTRLHAEAIVQGQANILADEVQRELQMVDQSVAILQAAWNANADKFDLKSWQARMPALSALSEDVFIANNHRIVVQDILPQAIGQGIAAAYVNYGHGALEVIPNDGGRANGTEASFAPAGDKGMVRAYLMYLVRQLEFPSGWIVGASYQSKALVKVFTDGSLGSDGVTALIDTAHGEVQAVAGPAAQPGKVDVSQSRMFRVMKERGDIGTWTGPTAMDGVMRIHAFHRVPGWNLVVLTGVDRADWMASSDKWAWGLRGLAAIASVLVLLIGGVVSWELARLTGNQRMRRNLQRFGEQLAAARESLATVRVQGEASAAQLHALLQSGSDGVAEFDGDWRLARCNPQFVAASGVAADTLKPGLALDELFRQQAQAGVLGAVDDVEAEVAQRMNQIREQPDGTELHHVGPDEDGLATRVRSMPGGGLLLIVTGLAPAPAADAGTAG